MKFAYCPHCGRKLDFKEIGDEGLVPFCQSCEVPYFDYFGHCTISVVINESNEVALLRQEYVSKTNWVLVAGFIKQGESLETAAIREVDEETGQKVIRIEYVSSYFYDKKELLMTGFKCEVKKDVFNNSKEVDRVEWFPIDEAVNLVREGSIAQKLLINVKKSI